MMGSDVFIATRKLLELEFETNPKRTLAILISFHPLVAIQYSSASTLATNAAP